MCQDVLVPQGRVPPTLLSKAILETASGAKLWQTLRSLSDYALIDHILIRYHKSEVKDLPQFVQSVMQAKREMGEESDELGENRDPNQTSQMSQITTLGGKGSNTVNLEINPTNANLTCLKRNVRASQVHLHSLMQDFMDTSRELAHQQSSWTTYAAKLND